MRLSALPKDCAAHPLPPNPAGLTDFEQAGLDRRKCKHCKHIGAGLDQNRNFWEIAAYWAARIARPPAFHDPFGRSRQMELAVQTPTIPHEERKIAAQRVAAEMFQQQPDWI